MTKLFAKIVIIILPCFSLVSGIGLYVIVEQEVGAATDQLALRVGNAAARAASGLTRLSARSPPLAADDSFPDLLLAGELLNSMMADPAVRCVELRVKAGSPVIAAAPRRLGCRAENPGELNRLNLPVMIASNSTPWILFVMFDSDELAALRHSRLDHALFVLLSGIFIAVLSAGIAFHFEVQRPLSALLNAIRATGDGQCKPVSFSSKSDELGVVINAFNELQVLLTREKARVSDAMGELRQVYDRTPGMLCSLDRTGHIIEASQYCHDRLGHGSDSLIGQSLFSMLGSGDATSGLSTLRNLIINGSDIRDLSLRLQSPRGQMDILFSAIKRECKDDSSYLCVITEITELKKAQAMLERLAMTDVLTDLPNRRSFMDELSLSLQEDAPEPKPLDAMLFVDLDNFKAVNDSLGHEAGDKLLVEAAKRLRACAGPANTVARLGGDEFAILICQGDRTPEVIAQEIVEAIAAPFDPPVRPGLITASVGIACLSRECTTPDDIVRRADQAMYDAKDRGKSCYATFEAKALIGNDT